MERRRGGLRSGLRNRSIGGQLNGGMNGKINKGVTRCWIEKCGWRVVKNCVYYLIEGCDEKVGVTVEE